MNIHGHVRNGVIVLDESVPLPEGAEVTVAYPRLIEKKIAREQRRIQVPLVRTGQPGSVNLTGERIAEILDEEDASPRR